LRHLARLLTPRWLAVQACTAGRVQSDTISQLIVINRASVACRKQGRKGGLWEMHAI
jgi:hypothetical protein